MPASSLSLVGGDERGVEARHTRRDAEVGDGARLGGDGRAAVRQGQGVGEVFKTLRHGRGRGGFESSSQPKTALGSVLWMR